MESDDEESFAAFGRPLEQYEEGAVPRKPQKVQDQTVRDDKGRQRFHGAFTGGFSAGYFNSVGSKEGWVPTTFVSSREKKAEKQVIKPEDFMDQEDLSSYGIAPREVTTTEKFASKEGRSERKKTAPKGHLGLLPGVEELIVASKSSMGMRLLQHMGWKDGQGIGARVKRKPKTQKPSEAEGGGKVYGCAMPPDLGSDEELEDDDYTRAFTFAPKDTTPISFTPKDDLHGIGYKGINPHNAMGHVNLFEAPVVTKTGHKGIRGQAFGTGALNEDDDDIYAMDHMSNYNTVIGGDEEDKLHGWTAPGRKSRFEPQVTTTITKTLEGFSISNKHVPPKPVFPPPSVPKSFKPFHVFDKTQKEVVQKTDKNTRRDMSAIKRGEMIGEQPHIASVFELISKADKDKLSISTKPSNEFSKMAETGLKSRFASSNDNAPTQESKESSSQQPLYRGGRFKPFEKDAAKQKRYDEYLSLSSHGQIDAYNQVAPSNMTEWEREREKEEFKRASQLYRPMSSVMATRFTKAKFSDAEERGVEVPKEDGGDVNDQKTAAKMKMFGKMTRDVFEWHPAKTVCKRFNVPDPYPASSLVGLPTVKKDKYSLFNFLSLPGDRSPKHPEPSSPPRAIEYKGESDASDTPAKTSAKPSETSDIVTQWIDKKKEEEVPNKDEVDKPPIDLFKAIFEDDDSDTSDDDSNDDDDNINNITTKHDATVEIKEEPGIVDEVDPDHVQQNSKQLVNTKGILSIFGDFEAKERGTFREQSLQQRLTGEANELYRSSRSRSVERSDVKCIAGPALPPGFNKGFFDKESATNSGRDGSSHRKHKKDRHRDKKKHKKDKKKSKKKKSKKKHKSRKSHHKSDSDSDSEYEDTTSDDDVKELDLDDRIMKTLKSLPSNKRLRAADFM